MPTNMTPEARLKALKRMHARSKLDLDQPAYTLLLAGQIDAYNLALSDQAANPPTEAGLLWDAVLAHIQNCTDLKDFYCRFCPSLKTALDLV